MLTSMKSTICVCKLHTVVDRPLSSVILRTYEKKSINLLQQLGATTVRWQAAYKRRSSGANIFRLVSVDVDASTISCSSCVADFSQPQIFEANSSNNGNLAAE